MPLAVQCRCLVSLTLIMPNTKPLDVMAAPMPGQLLMRWPALYFAFTLFVLDALVMGQGLVAALTLIGVGVWLLPKAYLFVLVGRNAWPTLRLAAVLGVAAIAIMVTINFNNGIARERAEQLVQAIESYRTITGRYPADLDDLVPGYVHTVPRAKYTLSFNRFIYRNRGAEVSLAYVNVPPFGRPSYDFRGRAWRYFD